METIAILVAEGEGWSLVFARENRARIARLQGRFLRRCAEHAEDIEEWIAGIEDAIFIGIVIEVALGQGAVAGIPQQHNRALIGRGRSAPHMHFFFNRVAAHQLAIAIGLSHHSEKGTAAKQVGKSSQ